MCMLVLKLSSLDTSYSDIVNLHFEWKCNTHILQTYIKWTIGYCACYSLLQTVEGFLGTAIDLLAGGFRISRTFWHELK